MRSGAAYLAQLQALLPEGPAWSRDEEATLTLLLAAFADGLAPADLRALQLLEEADPLTALEMLPDWERAVGLPDPCSPIAQGVRERQLAVARKLAGIGGQSRDFYVQLALLIGLEVEIEEFEPFTAGGSCAGDRCQSDVWRFAWLVRLVPGSDSELEAYDIDLVYFTAGNGRSGDRLRTFGSAHLECVITRAKPAHTEVLFSYDVDPEPLLWFDFVPA